MTSATWKEGAKFASTAICRNTLSTARELVTSQIWQFPQICNLKWKGGNPKQKGQPLLFNIQYRQLQRLKWCTWALNDFRAELLRSSIERRERWKRWMPLRDPLCSPPIQGVTWRKILLPSFCQLARKITSRLSFLEIMSLEIRTPFLDKLF